VTHKPKEYDRILLEGRFLGPEDSCYGEYIEDLTSCYMKLQRYNSSVMDCKQMQAALSDITQQEVDAGTRMIFPFRCDLGYNIILGKNLIINYNCTFLDTAPITIGDNTMIGPDCHLVTAIHPMDPAERRDHRVGGKPITIGIDCWLGANVTVLPGVTIGDRCIIGAGSVVTKDVPDGMTYAGNPARPVVHRG